jgi:signal transduction histidine kinase
MQDLIDAFLALGRQPTDPSTDHPLCAVNDLVRAQIERARAQAPPGAPDVVFIEEATVNLPCPAALLTVAVRNLLDNALHYAPGGDVRVTLRADALRVEDSGPGLAQDDLDRAFDRHWRRPPTTPGGEGLGLAIVRRICARSGWQVQAQSGPHGLRVVLQFLPEECV